MNLSIHCIYSQTFLVRFQPGAHVKIKLTVKISQTARKITKIRQNSPDKTLFLNQKAQKSGNKFIIHQFSPLIFRQICACI